MLDLQKVRFVLLGLLLIFFGGFVRDTHAQDVRFELVRVFSPDRSKYYVVSLAQRPASFAQNGGASWATVKEFCYGHSGYGCVTDIFDSANRRLRSTYGAVRGWSDNDRLWIESTWGD